MSGKNDDLVNCLWKQIEELLSLSPEEREDVDINNVSTWFKRNSLFHSLDQESLTSIIRQAELVRLKVDQIVVHQGDVGSCFFIILRGSVVIYAKKVTGANEEVILPDVSFAKGPKERARFGQELNLLRAGRCFGELSIISKNSTRNATVIADEPCILVCVNKELYSQYVNQESAAEIAFRSSFIAMHPLFRGWPAAYRNLLTENLQYRRLKFDEHIVKQGDPLDAVFFIINGQAKLKVNPIQHNSSFPKLLEPLNKNKSSDDEDDDLIDPFKKISVMERRRLKQTQSFHAAESRFRELEVCTLGPHGIIGDIESIMDLNQHISTAVCIEEMSLYEMDKSSFVRFIVKKNPETYERMRRSVCEKLMYRNNLYEGGIPIYRVLLTCFDKPKPKDNRKQILNTYNVKNNLKKKVPKSFFEEMSKGRSTNNKSRKQPVQPVRRPMHEAMKPREHENENEEDKQNTQDDENNKSKKGRNEGGKKQFTQEEYKELKKKLQVAGKTA